MNLFGSYQILNTVDTISDIVDEMSDTFEIISIANVSGTTYRVSVYTTLYITDYNFVQISGTNDFTGVYRIENVSENSSFDISYSGTGTSFTNGTYNLKILFKHGTYNRIVKDLERETIDNRTAVISLIERITEDVNVTRETRNYKESDIRVNFCTPYSLDWTSDNHNDYAIKPLENLVNLFCGLAGISTWRQELNDQFGRFSLFTGYEKHLLGQVDAIEIFNTNFRIQPEYLCSI